MFEDLNPIILFRMTERMLLTAVVVLVAIVVLIGFWKTVQKVTLKDGGPLGIAGSFALSTPVFALLAIILYAWVSVSHPISFGTSTAAPDMELAQSDLSAEVGAQQFTGALNAQSRTVAQEEVSTYARQRTRQQIWTLNCLIDASVVRPSAEADLAEIKITLMRSVWDDAWGSPARFEQWARNPANQPEPSGEAMEFYQGRHTGC
jgi:hypothetical protein